MAALKTLFVNTRGHWIESHKFLEMQMKRFLVTIFILWATCSSSPSYQKSYSPFEQGESPQEVAFDECVASGGDAKNPDTFYFSISNASSSPTVKLQLIKIPWDMWQITVSDRSEKPLCNPVTNDMPSHIIRVFTADLNQDGDPDFMVNICSLGCGLTADGSTTTFLLSDRGRYQSTNFYNLTFSPEDIIRFKSTGPFYFIQNDLIGNGKEMTKDGRDHNFWVYQLYKFSGTQMIKANKDDPRFPKWVWFTFKENHKETDLLNADQKKRLLKRSDNK